jgi:hypothetical protein
VVNPEAPEISWIRSYSNFLTPRLGIASADAWAGVVLILRNLILNWLVLLPALCALLLLLKLAAIAAVWISLFPPQRCDSIFYAAPLALGVVCLIGALRFTTRNRPSRGNSKATPGTFFKWDLAPAIVSAFLLSVALTWSCTRDQLPIGFSEQSSLLKLGLIAGAITYAVGWLVAWPKSHNWKDRTIDLTAWIVAGAVFGGIVGIGIQLYTPFSFGRLSVPLLEPSEILLLACGLPWVFGAQLVGDMIFAGLSSYEENSDADQEWLGRAAGYFLVTAVGWFLVVVFVFARWDTVVNKVPNFVADHYSGWLAAVGGVSGIITWVVGQSGLSSATGEAKNRLQISAKWILAIAGPIFAATILIAATVLLDQIVVGKALTGTDFFKSHPHPLDFPRWPEEMGLLGWALFAIGAVGVIACCSSISIASPCTLCIETDWSGLFSVLPIQTGMPIRSPTWIRRTICR